jgi:hypothetical protein
MIGWEGDLTHYSLLRFSEQSPGALSGTVEFMTPQNLNANEPYFPCFGTGTWAASQRRGLIWVQYPPTCSATIKTGANLLFQSFYGASVRWGAALQAAIQVDGTDTVDGFWYPTGNCDGTTTTPCFVPFG